MILPSELAGGAFLFDPGIVYLTTEAQKLLTCEDIDTALLRHLRGDWIGMDAEDIAANERAVRDGGRVFALYRTSTHRRFYIITEADRSATTILMPRDY